MYYVPHIQQLASEHKILIIVLYFYQFITSQINDLL